MRVIRLLLPISIGAIALLHVCADEPKQLFSQYCIDCHEGSAAEANLDLSRLLNQQHLDRVLIFENIATGKMPPADADAPSKQERRMMLSWLAAQQPESSPNAFRRISRHEFVHSVNDLLGTNLDLAAEIPDDRETRDFETDRRIQLSREMLSSYFAVADDMLEHALPAAGFPEEQTWITNQLLESHPTYNIYVRDYEDGLLFSWTRANNGNSYSFFFDNFDPPVKGWYELTLDAAKVGDLEGDVSIQVHAGKYYYADDRPQPQRLVDVISVGSDEVESTTIRAFLRPRENVSVHCFHPDNFREKDPQRGAYIRQLKVRGPLTPSPLVPRNPAGGSVQEVVRRFAERAFSSKLTDAELQPYYQVAEDALIRDGDLIEAVKVGFKAVICSHRFLMIPGEHSSEELEQKSTLARTLWLSIPDVQLRESSASLRDQITEMILDKRSDRMIQSLCNQWLNLRSWNSISPSLKLYPRYDDLLDHYLPLETFAYVSYLIRENRPVRELIDSDYSFLNQRLADHYGVEGVVGQQLRKVSLDPDVPRGGLLTMGSILKVTTDGFDTSPILRGAWISKNLVGTPVSPPPESVKAIVPAHGDTATSLREQIEQHKNSEACYACHKSIDPYGFALENFDATGQWRTRYRAKNPHTGTFQFRLEGYFRLEAEVDAAGEIDNQQFTGIGGLKELLLSNEQKIAYNFAKKFFEYANGYEPDLEQRLALLSMTDTRDCRMRDLVIDVLLYSIGGDSR